MKETLFRNYKKGSKVNIETDMFARYIAHILQHRNAQKNTLTWDEVDAISSTF